LRAGATAPGSAEGRQHLGRLLVTGIALSIDNLAVGFALGAYHVGLPLAAAVIGTVSVVMSLAGLELGARIGMRAGQRGEFLGGLVLIGVGAAIGTGVI
jgi:manganese efflux pump family protein